MLRSTVYIPVWINILPRNRPNVNYMPRFSFLHMRKYDPTDLELHLNIRINHPCTIVCITRINRVQPLTQPCVIDKNINLPPFLVARVERLDYRLLASYIHTQTPHIDLEFGYQR